MTLEKDKKLKRIPELQKNINSKKVQIRNMKAELKNIDAKLVPETKLTMSLLSTLQSKNPQYLRETETVNYQITKCQSSIKNLEDEIGKLRLIRTRKRKILDSLLAKVRSGKGEGYSNQGL